jgi:hypothetical protein
MTDPSPVFRMDAFLRTRFEDFGLELQFSNLVDDFRIGQRRNVAGILVVRDRGKHPTHDHRMQRGGWTFLQIASPGARGSHKIAMGDSDLISLYPLWRA